MSLIHMYPSPALSRVLEEDLGFHHCTLPQARLLHDALGTGNLKAEVPTGHGMILLVAIALVERVSCGLAQDHISVPAAHSCQGRFKMYSQWSHFVSTYLSSCGACPGAWLDRVG